MSDLTTRVSRGQGYHLYDNAKSSRIVPMNLPQFNIEVFSPASSITGEKRIAEFSCVTVSMNDSPTVKLARELSRTYDKIISRIIVGERCSCNNLLILEHVNLSSSHEDEGELKSMFKNIWGMFDNLVETIIPELLYINMLLSADDLVFVKRLLDEINEADDGGSDSAVYVLEDSIVFCL